MDLRHAIASRVTYLRNYHNLTQIDLAKKSKVCQSTIAQIESKRRSPSIEVLWKICSVFKVSLEDFFGMSWTE